MLHAPSKRSIARNIAKERGWSGRMKRAWKSIVWGITKSPMKHPRLGPGGVIRAPKMTVKGKTVKL